MKPSVVCIRIRLLLGAFLLMGGASMHAQEMTLFVSAFASGEEGAIHAFRLQLDTGALRPIDRTTDAEFPFFLAVSPDGRFLYSIHAPGQFGGPEHEQVAAYEVAGSTGQLTLLNRQSARGSAACYLEVDATGRTLVLANYLTGSVVAFPIQPDGSLGRASSFHQLAGSSVDAERQQGPHTHCAVISPDNRFVLAADLGIDQILIYHLDHESSRLVPHRQPFARTPPGAGPRHLTFHPTAKYVYVVNELRNSVTHFDYDAAGGFLFERQTVSTLPEDFDGTSYCADVKIRPDGRFLYATNRGHDSIAVYRIGDDGSLEFQEIVPSGGQGPQNLAITPGGELLLCANMPGNNVVVFRIDSRTGGLARAGQTVTMPSPSCMLFLSWRQ